MLREHKGWRPSLAILVCLLYALQTSAQTTVQSSADPAMAKYEAGIELERAAKWAEAIRHYESAVRQFPTQQTFKDRLTISRMHFDVRRRYQDTSFLGSVDSMALYQALDLYDEVLKNLERNYVENLQWSEVLRHGTASLEVALIEPKFVERHLSGVAPQQIEEFRQTARHYIANRPKNSRYDLRSNASLIAGVAKQKLGLSPTATVWEYVCGAIATLDSYSRFLTGNQLDETFANIEGNFVGLGVELKALDQRLEIVSVIPGGPAAEAGLKAGESIVAVEGKWTKTESPDLVADLLRGVEGSFVNVVIESATAQERSLRIARRRVEVPSVEGVRMTDTVAGTGYLKLTNFQKTTIRDIDRALWTLHQQGMKTLIMDLRGNPGGLLTAGVDLADRFLRHGRIVQTRGRNVGENFDYVAHQAGTWDIPLILLVDEDSASASEIFAAAIADHGRGRIIGQRTYGKGTVQGIFRMKSAHAGLCLTTAKFFSPKGRAISGNGVTPDDLIPIVPDEDTTLVMRPVVGDNGQVKAPVKQDVALQRAIEFAQGNARLSQRR